MSESTPNNPIPAIIGVETLAELAGLTPRRIQQLAQGGTIPTASRGQYPAVSAIKALFGHFREMASDNTEELAREKLRKATADADTAEVDAANAKNEIMLVEDQKQVWADQIISVRRVFDNATYIPAADRERLIAQLLAIKTEEE